MNKEQESFLKPGVILYRACVVYCEESPTGFKEYIQICKGFKRISNDYVYGELKSFSWAYFRDNLFFTEEEAKNNCLEQIKSILTKNQEKIFELNQRNTVIEEYLYNRKSVTIKN